MTTPVSFIDAVNQCIESGEIHLPVFNANAARIQREMVKEDPDIEEVEKIINSDQALAGEVLKIANSPFYRGLAEVGTVRMAVMRLGVKEVGRIVLLASSKQLFISSDKALNQMMKKLWQHSVGCAYGAIWLARRYPYGVDQSQAFFASLFHDIGKLLILMVIEHIKRKNRTAKIPDTLLAEAMTKLHAREGGKLLQGWSVPEYLWVVAQDHHNEQIDEKNYLLLLVRMANLVCHKLGIGLTSDPALILPATFEAHLLNLSEIDLAELEIFLEDTEILTN